MKQVQVLCHFDMLVRLCQLYDQDDYYVSMNKCFVKEYGTEMMSHVTGTNLMFRFALVLLCCRAQPGQSGL